ncbi:MAG: aspartate-semialdehyde dehydrogenase [Firmicutes bacterium]|nr:aspartate-semialdehyde dehydrogenase [Bacillota bacterium]MBQ3199503.1 aspartate-semialdehyde dehydrogenase [Bacillota bacterium]
MKKYNVAIVGATGAVGHELLKVLAERDFPINNLVLLASARSEGKIINWQGQDYTVHEAKPESFEGVDIVLFAGGNISKTLAPEAVKRGAVCIDNSSTFRYDPEVPLVVPEVNPEDVRWHKGIIANPNCSTIQMVVALKPLYDAFGIKRVVVATYQAVSGAGKEGLDELQQQIKDMAAGNELKIEAFQHQIACNVIPHIDIFLDNDYTKEEMKMTWETQKMLHNEDILLSATAVRVPVYRSHAEAIHIETEKPVTAEEARAVLAAAPGVVIQDDPAEKLYPMPLYSSDTDEVYVGRIRKDIAVDNGLSLFVVADQIRKGAATNAVQIAQLLVAEGLV